MAQAVYLLGDKKITGLLRADEGFFALQLDALLREQHRWSASVSSYPVEDALEISDHIQPQADEIEIEGIISNAPCTAVAGDHTADITVQGQTQSVTLARPVEETPTDYAGAALATLRELHEARALITVVTSLDVYSDMAITGIEIPREAQTGAALVFSMTLKKVRKVSPQAVIIAASGSADQATPAVDMGTQVPMTIMN